MVTKIKKDKPAINKPETKKFDAKKFLGLVKWNEEGVIYQRRLRDDK